MKHYTSNGFGPEYFIRHYIDDVYACVWGKKCDRKLLNWAQIERWAMQQWCERQGVPLPEFWFPPGWKLDYEWPRGDEDQEATPAAGEAAVQESDEERSSRLNKHHRAKLACQQVASAIWSKEPGLTIKEVACRREVQELAGGSQYELETVQAWVGEVDPRSAARKRGRKRKNNSGLADSNN